MSAITRIFWKFLLTFLVIIQITAITTTISFADENGTGSAKIKSLPSYSLAYPGMLPDNPLYPLKVLRDKFATFLINDPMKKIDFYLLRADKGLSAASMLLDKNEGSLAKTTALKGENNITELVSQVISLPQKPDSELFTKLFAASNAHQLLLENMVKKTKGDDQKTFQMVFNFSKSNQQTLQRLSKLNSAQWQNR